MAIVNLLIFFLALSLLVVVHELGHLLFAKKFGIYCYEFSVGMGPRLGKIKKGETQYSFKAFPIGGSVMMAGEEFDEATKQGLGELYMVDVPAHRTLYGIAKWKRLFVVGGGALFNFIFGFILIFLAINIQGYKVNTGSSKIIVEAASLIYEAGVRSEDEITKVSLELFVPAQPRKYDEFTVTSYVDLKTAIDDPLYLPTKDGEYQVAIFTYIRNETTYESSKIYRFFDQEKGLPFFGFTATTSSLTLLERFTDPFIRFGEYSTAVFKGLGRILTGAFGDVSGPVGIFNYSSEMATYGLVAYLFFLALLSVNLGIFNLIPFPGLDGATIFMTAGEMISGKEIPAKYKGYINIFGFLILILLIILVSIKDIVNIFTIIGGV